MRREWRKAPQQLRLAGYENPYDYLIDRLWKNYSHHHNQNHGCGKKVREIFLSSCVNDSSTTLAAASSRFYFYPTGENFPPNKSSMKVRWRWKIPLRVGRNFYFQFTKKKKKIFLLPFGKFSNNEIRLLSEGTARKARLNTKESRSALHSANCFKSSTVQSPVIIDFSIFPSGLLSCSYQFLVHVALRLRKSINARRASSRLEWRDEQRDEKLSSLVQ